MRPAGAPTAAIGHCLVNRTGTRRALSRSRHPLQGRARALSRRRLPHGARRQGAPLDAQERRADQGIGARDGRPISSSTSTPTASRSITWDMPGRSMNVIDLAVIDGTGGDRREGRSRRRDQGRGHHLRQGHVLRRRRSDAARERSAARSPRLAKAQRRGGRGDACCSRRAASCRSSIGGSRPAASRGSRRSTAPRSAAASSCVSPAISASPPTTTRPASACPR